MSTSTAPAEILFTAAEVAKFAGVEESTLKKYEPDGFGSPGHWRMAGANVVYTVKGCRLLAQTISMAGNEEGADALLVAVNKVEEAQKVPAQPAPPSPAWTQRADLQ